MRVPLRAAGQAGRDDRLLEALERAGDVDALAPGLDSPLLAPMPLAELEVRDVEGLVDRGVRRDGDEHAASGGYPAPPRPSVGTPAVAILARRAGRARRRAHRRQLAPPLRPPHRARAAAAGVPAGWPPRSTLLITLPAAFAAGADDTFTDLAQYVVAGRRAPRSTASRTRSPVDALEYALLGARAGRAAALAGVADGLLHALPGARAGGALPRLAGVRAPGRLLHRARPADRSASRRWPASTGPAAFLALVGVVPWPCRRSPRTTRSASTSSASSAAHPRAASPRCAAARPLALLAFWLVYLARRAGGAAVRRADRRRGRGLPAVPGRRRAGQRRPCATSPTAR